MNLLKRALKSSAVRNLFIAIGVVLLLGAVIVSVLWRWTAPPATPPPGRTPSTPAAVLATLPPEEVSPPALYQSRERRDPFLPSRAKIQLEPEVNLKVTGIVWGPRAYYALVEPEPSDGKGYIIRENDVVNSARVLKITKQAVIFEVKVTSAEGRPLTRHVRKSIGP